MGPACPTKLGVKILILFSLCSARCCILPFHLLARAVTRLCLLLGSASLFPCMGGGFAAIPAYLKDLFGTYQVGAIHGRILLAWSTAAVIGPVLVNYIRQSQIESGVPAAELIALPCTSWQVC